MSLPWDQLVRVPICFFDVSKEGDEAAVALVAAAAEDLDLLVGLLVACISMLIGTPLFLGRPLGFFKYKTWFVGCFILHLVHFCIVFQVGP